MNRDDIRKAARETARFAIAELVRIMTDADAYLADGNDMAAWGTLILFDEAASDLKAALQLHRTANRRVSS